MKSLHYARGESPRGHSIQRLASECPGLEDAENEAWVKKGAELDRYYVPARYPNGLPDLTPSESFFGEDSERALANARWLLSRCEEALLASNRKRRAK